MGADQVAGRRQQWVAKDAPEIIPDAHVAGKFHKPTMLTTDLTLRFDPEFGKISRRFHDDPQAFADALARAPGSLIHRDMGPRARYLGPEVPRKSSSGKTRFPRSTTSWSTRRTSPRSRARCSLPDCLSAQLVSTAWASASTFRGSDKRGGANGARIRLAPQKDWEVQPAELAKVLQSWRASREEFNGAASGGKKVSLADLIVLAGCAGVEQAAKNAGHNVTVPFTPGRMDACRSKRTWRPWARSSRSPTASATT